MFWTTRPRRHVVHDGVEGEDGHLAAQHRSSGSATFSRR
jgi:hypothetical protein